MGSVDWLRGDNITAQGCEFSLFSVRIHKRYQITENSEVFFSIISIQNDINNRGHGYNIQSFLTNVFTGVSLFFTSNILP